MNQRPMEQAAVWLNGNIGRTLLIEKRESGDLDRVELKLERVTYREAEPREHDDYTDGSVLLLQGSGTVHSDDETLPLPGSEFVVPLHGLAGVSPEQASLSIHTERATYGFHVKQ